MQNWKLNIPLDNFIEINGKLPFYRDFINQEILTYQDLREKILKKKSDQQNNLNLFTISKKIQINEIVEIIWTLLNHKQVFIVSEQSGADKLTEFHQLVAQINQENKDLGPGVFLATSGSSSSAKVYFFTLEKILKTAFYQADALHILPGEQISCALPFYHVSGLMLLFRSIVAGACLVHHDMKEIESLASVDHISLVPTQILRMKSKDPTFKNLVSLKSVTIGGAQISAELKKDLNDHKVKFFESYGATETLGFALLNNKVMPHLQIILNQNHTPCFFGETLPDFYYQNQKKIPTLHFQNGITLNDELKKSHSLINGVTEIEYRFIQRLDLIFQSAAENISPLEIEETLHQNFNKDLLADNQFSFIVTKYPDPDYQWVPLLSIILSNPIHSQQELEIKNHCIKIFNEQLLPLKRPRFINIQILPKFFEEKVGRSIIENLNYKKLLEHLFECKFPDNDDHQATLIFHGFMGHKNDFSFLKRQDTEENKYYLTTLPWHSSHQENEFFFRDTKAVVEQTKNLITLFGKRKSSLHLIGYSMGGRLLLQGLLLALKNRPELGQNIIALTLISTGWGLKNEQDKNLRKVSDDQLFNEVHTVNDLEIFYRKWYQQPLFGGDLRRLTLDEDYAQKASMNFLLIPNFKKALQVFGQPQFPTEPQTKEEVATILKTLKIHLITGEKDVKYYQLAASLLNWSRNHQLNYLQHLVIPQAFHDPHKTHPTEMMNIITKLRLEN